MGWTPEVGQRVRAKVDIVELSATFSVLTAAMARRGDELIVRATNRANTFPIVVSPVDNERRTFGVWADEIEPV